MAVLVLVPLASAAVGSAGLTAAAGGFGAALAGATITTAVGALGAWVDTTFIYPMLFKQKGQEGPRLDDLRVQEATEGSPKQLVIGEIRTGGTLIWSSDLIERKKKSGGGKKPKQTSYSYSVDIAIAFGHGPRGLKKLWANGKLIYDGTDDPEVFDARYEELVWYPGNTTQDASPLIEAYESDVPAWRRTCYVTLQGLQLNDFGNTIPVFTALIAQVPAVNLRTAVQSVFEHAAWNSDFYDVSAVPTDPFRGMLISGPTQLSKALEPILFVYDLVARETESVIEILPRSETDTVEIDEEDLGFAESQPARKYLVDDKSEKDLPSQVDVRFIDCDHEWDQGSKSGKNPLARTNNIVTVDVPLSLTPEEARKLAEGRVWQSYVENQRFSTSLPPKLWPIQEQDLLTREIGGRAKSIRVTEIARGWNKAVEIDGYFEREAVRSGLYSPDYEPGVPPTSPLGVRPVRTWIMQLPPLRDEDVNNPGVYIASGRLAAADGYRAATVYFNFDGSDDFIEENSVTMDEEAIMGTATSTLPAPVSYEDNPAPAPHLVLDEDSELDVEIDSGELSSKTEAEVLAGQNLMLVGNEIIAFRTATLTGTAMDGAKQYTLTNLYRGVRDTAHAIETHEADETVVLLNSAIRFFPVPISVRGNDITYRVVPMYGFLNNFSNYDQEFRAENVKCFRVTDISFEPGTGEDIVFTWKRQSRNLRNILDTSSGPLEEPNEKYFVRVSAAAGVFLPEGTIIYEGFVTEPEFTLTTAMQDDAGMPYGDYVKVRIIQIGEWVDDLVTPWYRSRFIDFINN